ncbi:MAG: hypothetical protein HOP27_12205 [Anaerolineales bacterium]|nr:hypothetical protein [Anaerolineales bacterium]
MPHTIIHNSEADVIEIKIQGDLTLSVVKEIVSEAIHVAKEQNCFLILNDMSEATIKLSTFEIYDVPKIMSDMVASSGLNMYKLKRAFVAAKDLKDYKFFETVTVNRAQRAKFFFDIDEARKWLSGK